MRFDLAVMVRRFRRPRRKQVPIRDIAPTGVLATDLYQAAYSPAVQIWQRANGALEAEYARTLSGMTTDSPADLERDLGNVDDELRRLLIRLSPRLRDWLVRVETWHRGKWRGAVLSATGVDLSTMIGPEDVAEPLEAILRRNIDLIRDISDEARGRIADSIYRGLTNRRSARDVARELREAVGMARSRALRVASDQLTKATSTLDTERMRQAGIEKWKWKHSGKLHYRPEHLARDGKIYSFAEPPPDMPGELPYCGCRKLALISFD